MSLTQYDKIISEIAEMRKDFKSFNDKVLEAVVSLIKEQPCKNEKRISSLEKRIQRLEKLNGIKD